MAQNQGPLLQAATGYRPAVEDDFALDIETIAAAPVLGALLNDTGDGCTSTCASACSNSTCISG
ncbi:FxLD family lanthipeptide [Streptacidiphilus sp. MAP5-52]|uniref:FxLD family lanthipeptide n=1 Tax=Streptacidiphilus sp. MAP5-52 TaxID=3156267 RepID=UPI0035120FD8